MTEMQIILCMQRQESKYQKNNGNNFLTHIGYIFHLSKDKVYIGKTVHRQEHFVAGLCLIFELRDSFHKFNLNNSTLYIKLADKII